MTIQGNPDIPMPATIIELVQAWKHDLNYLDNTPDQEVAGYIVGHIIGNEHFDNWFDSDEMDPDVEIVLDLASELELPQGAPSHRQRQWKNLKQTLNKLEQRYPKSKSS